ncbi:MAG: helix-turn-helix domain-containing protein, partial [Thermoanaerobaculia bacterium]
MADSDAPKELAVSDEVFLRELGDRVRGERARRGMSRRMLAEHSGMSERYIAQIEGGKGNISILLLRQLAAALELPLGRLLERDAGSPEMALLAQFLTRLTPQQLKDAHSVLAARFASDAAA